MTFRIKRAGEEHYLASDIDPGGMSVSWGSKKNADTWADRAEAKLFMVRVAERYPNETMEVVGDVDAQPQTFQGLRGQTQVTGLTYSQLYNIVRERIEYFRERSSDPDAFCQNVCCEVEKVAGIYPNVPKPLPLLCDRCGTSVCVTSNLMFDLCPGCTQWLREEHARYAARGQHVAGVTYMRRQPPGVVVRPEHVADRSTPSWLGRVAGRFFGSAH